MRPDRPSAREAAGRPGLAILAGGGIAATLDIVYACVSNAQYFKTPLWVFQAVASGWLGKESFEGGVPAGALGLASHYGILFVAAGIYLAASRRLAILHEQPIVCGTLFGIAVYLFMNFVVLPLSAFPWRLAHDTARFAEGFASHALFVGMPIALCVRRFGAGGGGGG
jgi:hypothetical protein